MARDSVTNTIRGTNGTRRDHSERYLREHKNAQENAENNVEDASPSCQSFELTLPPRLLYIVDTTQWPRTPAQRGGGSIVDRNRWRRWSFNRCRRQMRYNTVLLEQSSQHRKQSKGRRGNLLVFPRNREDSSSYVLLALVFRQIPSPLY